jgi:branched-chain amino acid transport system ATP-binding protein
MEGHVVSQTLLEVSGLSKNFGALTVANRVSLDLKAGSRHALIGPNGAGKTTLVNLITGALDPSAGHIILDGADITGLSQAQRVKRGLVRTFQINTLFRGLSVVENISLAITERRSLSKRFLRPAAARGDVLAEAMDVLGSLKLADDAQRLVRDLPYGRQRLVEIAIALGLRPKVLLLDEPAAGVSSTESHILLDAIGALPESIAVLMIEHDMDIVFRFANRVAVLVSGEILMEGEPREVAQDVRVREVYLGEPKGRNGAEGRAQSPGSSTGARP